MFPAKTIGYSQFILFIAYIILFIIFFIARKLFADFGARHQRFPLEEIVIKSVCNEFIDVWL